MGLEGIILPADNANEAAVVKGINVFPVKSLIETSAFLNGNFDITPHSINPQEILSSSGKYSIDFSDVKMSGMLVQ